MKLWKLYLLVAIAAVPGIGIAAEPSNESGPAQSVSADANTIAHADTPFVGPAGEALPERKSVPEALQEQAEDEDLEIESGTIPDPIEPWNRAMFHFNDKLYFWILKPAAQGYSFVVPEPARISVRNLFSNATMPVRLVNSLLQGKMKAAGNELTRFGINTTLGIAGLFDVAKEGFDINGQAEDTGQTFGHYGMDGLMYIVWPFMGPSTIRDTIGSVGDMILNPLSYVAPMEASMSVRGVEQINRTSLLIGEYEDIKEGSLDPYLAIRDAYIQHRRDLISK